MVIVAAVTGMFQKIWNKNEPMGWKDGAILNIILATSCAVIMFTFIFIFHASRGFMSIVADVIKGIMFGVVIVGLIRLKFKFAFSFLFTGFAISIIFAALTGIHP